jgi:hypothetical protein
MIRIFCALSVALMLAACGGGGGGGGGSSSSTTTTPAALTNFATLTVDSGPAALQVGSGAYTQDNVAYVSVTLCAPGSTTNCQTIDHIQVDTGSVGLRIFQNVLNSSLLSALPYETDASSNPVGECYTYIDGYVFGSVRTATFSVGGETVSNMPFQVMADTGQFTSVPPVCSSGGGTNFTTVQSFGSNGIIGIGTTTTDCGVYCTAAGGYSAAIYYDCPSSGCGSIIGRSAVTTAPFQQLPNPVAAMSVDNNGTIITLPSAPTAGEASMTGTIYFGIGTQTNNTLGSQTVLSVTTSSNPNGSGLLNAVYNSQTLNESFVDSGSNSYLFINNSIPICSGGEFAGTGYYCPTSPVSIVATLEGEGANSNTGSGSFTLYNAQTQLSTTNAVVPGIAANPNDIPKLQDYQNSFDFGLPFFYGRSVYTAIEGRTAGGTAGPYIAF